LPEWAVLGFRTFTRGGFSFEQRQGELMKLDFSRQGFVEALIHVLIMAAAASLHSGHEHDVKTDVPAKAAQWV